VNIPRATPINESDLKKPSETDIVFVFHSEHVQRKIKSEGYNKLKAALHNILGECLKFCQHSSADAANSR
jgi:hypothetical protein